MKLPDVLNTLRRILAQQFNRADDQEQNLETVSSAYKALADTKEGMIVMNDLLRFCGVGEDNYVEGDPHGTSRNTGGQRVGLRILNFIGADYSQFTILKREMNDEHQRHKIENAADTAILGEG